MDAAKHPTTHLTGLHNKKYLAQNVHSTKVENLAKKLPKHESRV